MIFCWSTLLGLSLTAPLGSARSITRKDTICICRPNMHAVLGYCWKAALTPQGVPPKVLPGSVVAAHAQVILGVIIDSVWPPRESPEACAKAAVAKYMVEQKAQEVQQIFRAAATAAAEATDEPHQEAAAAAAAHAEITVPGPQVGKFLPRLQPLPALVRRREEDSVGKEGR